MRVSLEARLTDLSEQIKKELMNTRHAKDEKSFQFETKDLIADVVIRDLTSLDENAFFDWFEEQAVHYCKLVPDPTKIEEAYLNGELKDADLRAIRKPKFSVALNVEPKNV